MLSADSNRAVRAEELKESLPMRMRWVCRSLAMVNDGG